jgi:arabinogalactan endo-1,4-beta-galactosidase
LLAQHHHLTPIFNVNFWTVVPKVGPGLVLELVVPPDLSASVTMADLGWRRRWVEHVTKVAREFQPAYFSLGNEIDSFYHYDQSKKQDFENYVSLVAESYDSIKQVAPKTRVMVIFRYEEMAAKHGFDLITKFNPVKLDIYGFTSYPDLQEFAKPADIPGHYYQPIRERVGNKSVAFTEIGWATRPGDPDGEQNQVDFLRWFLNETRDLNLEMVYWTFLHDLAPDEKKAARSSYLGLIDYYGRPKKAWGLWQKLAQLPLQR